MRKKKDIIGKLVKLLAVFFILLTVLIPTLSIGATNVERASSSQVNEISDSSGLMPNLESQLSSTSFNEPNELDTTESTTENMTKTKAEESENELQDVMAEKEVKASTTNIINSVVVNDWELFRFNGQSRESLTTAPKSNAIPNQAYNFGFSWSIPDGKLGRNILPGDYFVLNIPQNDDPSTGNWYALPGEWHTVTTQDETPKGIYRYRIENSTTDNTQVIRFEFLEGVDQLQINSLDSDLEFPGFMNYVTKSSVQNVAFGQDTNGAALSKSITFNKIELGASNGFSFKHGTPGSSHSIKWDIQFNGASNVELGGDEVDYDINGGEGSVYQGFYTDKPDRDVWHPWGTNYTDIYAPAGKQGGGELGGYVEDELPADAEVTTLTIAAYIQIPIGLSQENYEKQEGVYLSSAAPFQSFVLADYGDGPTYRASGDTSEVQSPKAGTGFTQLKQLENETKTQFKVRIQAAPYQYGVYKEQTTGISTVMMHYGTMKKANNEQQKLSDLTNTAYTGREITNPKSNQIVKITQFAAQAADFTIKRGFYAEEDRELLENYYSITFGDTNAIGGKIASYNISLTVRYPPSTPSGPIRNESAIYTHSALTLKRKPPETMPKLDGDTVNLKNSYGSITLNANQALLQKFDVERDENDEYIPINGAKFKLQVKDGSNWSDVKKDGNILTFITDGIQYYEVENGVTVEKTANGLVKVDFGALGLANGTYRFVETKAAAGYVEETKVSDEFVIPSTTSRGPTVTVWNKKLPQAKYTVKHYVQKGEGNTAKDNFELRETEEKSGYVGQEIVGEPSMNLLKSYEYNETLSLTHGKISGTVIADGTLTLELYYTIAADVPFTLYKQGMNGEAMPSVDSSGKQLLDEQGREKKVAFDIYEWVGTGNWSAVNPYEQGQGPVSMPSAWRKVNDKPVITDALGRLRVPEITDLEKFYAVIEIATYPDYVQPDNEVYWVIRMNANEIFSMPYSVHGTQVERPDYEAPSETNGNRYIIKNRAPDISLFKVNEQGEAMPSSDQQKVQFDIYRWNGGGYFEESWPYSWGTWTKIKSSAATDNQGYFATIGQTGLEGSEQKNFDWYLIRETSTYSGYQQAEGYWLVSTAWNPSTQKFEIFEVKYKIIQNGMAVDDEDPGHKISDDKTNLYLTNKSKPISFYKEDEKKNPLGGVHFSLYKAKEGEAGINGSEDPEAVDTKWDMTNPIEKVSSDNDADKGKVTFDALTRGDYLLVETKTLPGYQLPLGYWIVTVDFYGEIETIRGRGDPLPPAFRVNNGKYYLPNYLKNSLPRAGGYLRVFLVVLGIVLLGSAGIVLQNRKKKVNDEKGKKDENKAK
ncbi:SpaA isopeptide-forming pilin-related protein [Enterococcus sp. AZ007]|uniref:SpaA isopeptide-forming pilin-related protein n=1 Tax=Enterococcus sp. AZ007 TaxID=2774839 RepID=UPI003F1EDC51